MQLSPSRPDRRIGGNLAAVALVFFSVAGGGCTTCDASCGAADGTGLEFTGELLAFDELIATFSGPDGSIEIYVEENIEFLDVGETYHVAAAADRRTNAEYSTHINPSCGCGTNITHADGQRIDTSFRRKVKEAPAMRLGLGLFVGVPAITLLAVAANRIRRGDGYDSVSDLPDDGEWVEYDDPDLEWDDPDDPDWDDDDLR